MLPIYIARRLTLSSGGRKSSPAVRVATLAVALSVAVMIIAIAVVIGFKREISDRVTGFNSDIVLTSLAGHQEGGDPGESESDPIVTLTPSLDHTLRSLPFVEDVALQVSIPAVIKTRDDFKGVYLKSLSGKKLREFVSSSLVEGSLPSEDDPGDKVLLSRRAAERLSLSVGDSVPAYFISDRLTLRRLAVVAIYDSHFDDYDENYAFAPLELIQRLGDVSGSQGTSVALAVDDFSNIDVYTAETQRAVMDALQQGVIYRPLRVGNAMQSGAPYFHWLSMLDMNVWVVILLMTAVACVTLVSGMLIIMVDKVRFIALMSALGGSRRLLSRVFVLLAVRVALTGLVVGDVIGAAFIFIQSRWRVLPLDPESYYMDFVPVAVNWWAFAALNAGVVLVVWLMLILPSRYVGKVSPARVLSRE